MNNVPDCMYDYRYDRYEGYESEIVDKCSVCDCDIYEGETYYDIDGLILCEECLSDYRKEG